MRRLEEDQEEEMQRLRAGRGQDRGPRPRWSFEEREVVKKEKKKKPTKTLFFDSLKENGSVFVFFFFRSLSRCLSLTAPLTMPRGRRRD